MSDKEVARFMVGMALDATALQRFHSDPDIEMRRFGLSDASMKVIREKDAVAINKAIKTNFAANADTVNVVVVVL